MNPTFSFLATTNQSVDAPHDTHNGVASSPHPCSSKKMIITVFEEISTIRVVVVKGSVDLHSKFCMNKLEDYPTMMNPKAVLHIGILAPSANDTLFELVVVR
mgnify:CR=1 FL=1